MGYSDIITGEVIVKISFDGASLRRRMPSHSLGLTRLHDLAASLSDGAINHFRYEDADGDVIVLKTEGDLREGLLVMLEKNSTTLNLEAVAAKFEGRRCSAQSSQVERNLLNAICQGKKLRKTVRRELPQERLPVERERTLFDDIRQGKTLRKIDQTKIGRLEHQRQNFHSSRAINFVNAINQGKIRSFARRQTMEKKQQGAHPSRKLQCW